MTLRVLGRVMRREEVEENSGLAEGTEPWVISRRTDTSTFDSGV